MSDELNVLLLVADRLDKTKIPYMVTGSIAANYYTIPRMTRDIDIVIAMNASDAQHLVSAFDKDFYIDVSSVTEAAKQRGMFNIIHNDTVVKVDLIVRKNEAYRQIEFERRCQVDVAGKKIWIVSREDLILSKLFWAKDSFSERQLDDVRNLLASSSSIDLGYVERWVKDLELEDVFRRVKP